MTTEGATGPDGGKKNTVRFETRSSTEKDQFFKGKHPSQHTEPTGPAGGSTGPAPGATGPAPGTTGPAPGVTGPAGGGATATGPRKLEDVILGAAGGSEPDWKAKALSLEEQLKKMNEKGPATTHITNPKLYRLQVIESETPEDAPLFHKIAYGTATSEELWKAGFLRDHPQFKDKPEDVQMYLENKYPLLFGEGADTSSTEYKFAKMEFDLEADRVRKSLQNRFDEIQLPAAGPANGEGDQKTIDTLATTWQPEFAKIKTGFEKLSISVPTTEKEVEVIDVEIPVEEQAKYLRAGAVYVLNEKLPVNAESIGKVSDYVKRLYIADHHVELMKQAWQKSADKMQQMMLDKTTNPRRIQTPSAGPTTPGTTPMEAFVKKVTNS